MSALRGEFEGKELKEKDLTEQLEPNSKADLDERDGLLKRQPSPAGGNPDQVTDVRDPAPMYQHDQHLSFDMHNMMTTLTGVDPLHPIHQGGQSWSTSPEFVSPTYQGIHQGGVQAQMPSHLPNQPAASSAHVGTLYYQQAQIYGAQPTHGMGTAPQSSTQPYGPMYPQQYPQFHSHQPPIYGQGMMGGYPVQPSLGSGPWYQNSSNQYGHMNQAPPTMPRPFPIQNVVFPPRPSRIAVPQRPHISISRPESESSGTSMTLRGPPRKPKQSGFALWCGNLPAQSHIVDLKNHFSRGAKDEIESVFLIAKTNCAFVNYRTEESCVAAQTRFHDQRFHGAKLVCRLRRTPASIASTPPTGQEAKEEFSLTETASSDAEDEELKTESPEVSPHVGAAPQRFNEKFFIIKSLTAEDLHLSVRTGSWATQSHNEIALTEAFKSAENVYLIFSANKSGEYFGYAKMISSIDEAPSASIETMAGSLQSLAMPTDSSLITPTPATEHAPKGHIIDDPARGTIFWEADRANAAERADQESEETTADDNDSEIEKKTLGHAFKIEWMSTNKIPFHRARGLKNPLNQNREVKIARDGTEIEPLVGRRLINLFHSPPYPAVAPGGPMRGFGPPFAPGSGPTQSPTGPYSGHHG